MDVRRRQLAAGAIALFFIVIVVLGIKSCSDSAAQRAQRAYARDISGIAQGSDAAVGRPLFRLLTGAGSGATKSIDLQNQVNNLKVQADDDLQRAQSLDVPGSLTEAQRNALLVLELRRNGVANIAKLLQTAIGGTNGGAAVRRIAGEMRNFDASDVIWSQRVIPLVTTGLTDAGIAVGGATGVVIARSTFLRDGSWLDPTYVAAQLGAAASGGGGGGAVKPGTHGHALLGVSAGAVALTPGAVARVPASATTSFTVKLQNQGQNDETRVRVSLTLTGAGPAQTVVKTLPTTTAGQTATADIPLAKKPTIGSVGTLKAEVIPVPGEKKVDNNSQTYQVLFTR